MISGSRNLVIVRAGDDSLHEGWMEPATERSFSLAVSYYGKEPGRWAESADRWVEAKGPKWGPLADFLDAEWDWVSQFDYIALPDDDLSATASDWDRLFQATSELGFDLAQPSLDYRSFWTHQITARRPAYRARSTKIRGSDDAGVFAVGPGAMSSHVSHERLGLGLDVVWPVILQKAGRQMGIVDEVAFGHTRPFNGTAPVDPKSAVADGMYRLLSHPPVIDEIVLSQVFGVAFPFDPVVYSAVMATPGVTDA